MFSNIPVTSQLTHPDTFATCQARGRAVATMPALTWPCAQSQMPTAAVATSSAAFITVSEKWNWVMSRMWRPIAAWCSSTLSLTYASSSARRANNLTVRMLV